MKAKTQVVLVLLLLFGLCPHAMAQRKTDIVTLYNGDRITGEVKSLYGGILNLSTDSMSTVKIEWQEIAGLESKYNYEIRLSKGERQFGSLKQSPQPGQLLIQDLYDTHSIDWLQVVELRPLEKNVIDRIDVYLAAGFSFNKASDVGQTSLNTVISYEDQNSLNKLTGRSTVTDTDEETTSSAKVEVQRYVWTDRSKLFRNLFSNYETNDELALDHRIGVGAGLGRYLIDTHKMRLIGASGLQVVTEQKPDTGEDQNVELYITSSFSTWRFNTPELDVDLSFNLYPSLTDSGRLRSDSNLRIRWEIVEDFFFDITAYGSTDNRADADSQFDYGVTTGIGWTY